MILYNEEKKSEHGAIGCVIIVVMIIIIISGLIVGALYITKPKTPKYKIIRPNETVVLHKNNSKLVQRLGKQGDICKVYGCRMANYDFDNRRCIVCSKEEPKPANYESWSSEKINFNTLAISNNTATTNEMAE